MRTFSSAEEIMAAVGEELGTSDWITIEQDRINAFADATGDHQWIHVDEAKAADGPFGTTIAHGFLTLSLLPSFGWQIYTVDNATVAINYGLNKVRFVNPVPVGSKLRSTAVLSEATDVAGGVHMVVVQTVEIEGQDKPACVAETVTRVYF